MAGLGSLVLLLQFDPDPTFLLALDLPRKMSQKLIVIKLAIAVRVEPTHQGSELSLIDEDVELGADTLELVNSDLAILVDVSVAESFADLEEVLSELCLEESLDRGRASQ